MTTQSLTSAPARLTDPLGELFRREPLFAGAALLLTAIIPPTLIAHALDDRVLNGVDIWVKPLKFEIALAIYLATLAWFAGWLPAGTCERPWYKRFSVAVILATAAEMIWIAGAAANGIASHFNTGTAVMGVIYGLMGLFAVLLTSASLVFGRLILAHRETSTLAPPVRLAVGLGLILTFALTLVAAGYLASQTGHHVAAGADDTGGLGLMGWSRTGGDLRVAHFFATHALHVVPALGFLFARVLPERIALGAVWAAAIAYTGLVLATFLEALLGQPFIA